MAASSVATTSAGALFDEARAGEHIEDLLAIVGFTQGPGGRWTGLLVRSGS